MLDGESRRVTPHRISAFQKAVERPRFPQPVQIVPDEKYATALTKGPLPPGFKFSVAQAALKVRH
jgi:hypothetical protein